MAHLVLNDVDPRIIEELRRRADLRGREITDEAKVVLEEALGLSRARALREAQRIRAELGDSFTESADLLREGRDG
jgi:F0F1-type ATP synthase membrane subunit b/b'